MNGFILKTQRIGDLHHNVYPLQLPSESMKVLSYLDFLEHGIWKVLL